MSRAMNLNLAEADVIAGCEEAGVEISAIETLPGGGTHLVTVTGDGAAVMRRALRDHVIDGRVKRFAFMLSRQQPPAAAPDSRMIPEQGAPGARSAGMGGTKDTERRQRTRQTDWPWRR
jgi:hypothetical protein